MFFGNRKKEQVPDTSSNTELYQGIRVMQDDLDDLSGKSKAIASASPAQTSQHTGASSGSPFLSDQYLAQTDVQIEAGGGIEKIGTAGTDELPAGDRTSDVFSGLKGLMSNKTTAGDASVEGPRNEALSEQADFVGDSGTNGKSWILLVSALALIALVAGAAAYIFLFSGTGGETKAPATEQQANVTQATEPNKPTETETAPFTQGMPNYLTIDIESDASTPEGIVKLLSDTDASVMHAKPSFPVEFVIRDANNNPVAFARFAYLLGLKIPLETLTSLDEGFSLYFVFDGNAVRRAVVMDIRQGKNVTKDLTDGETSLISWFGTMLYPDAVSIPSGTSFQSGSYGKLATRFINIESENDTSLDYVIMDKALVIGTSKDAFRSVLGTIVGSK